MAVKVSWLCEQVIKLAVFTCLHCLFVVAFQGDRGETGSPGPAGFAGPPVSSINGTEQILTEVSGLQV